MILDKIHHDINLARSNKLIQDADQKAVRNKRRNYFMKFLTKAAAILFIPLLGLWVYTLYNNRYSNHEQASFFQSYSEVYSSADAISMVRLSDGSKVWLNHSSSLKYPNIFQGKTRTVELRGEGYFEVSHNSKIPFIVNAGEIQIQAIGTAFNILAYPEDDRIEIFADQW